MARRPGQPRDGHAVAGLPRLVTVRRPLHSSAMLHFRPHGLFQV